MGWGVIIMHQVRGRAGVRGYPSICTLHQKIFSQFLPPCKKARTEQGSTVWLPTLGTGPTRLSVRLSVALRTTQAVKGG
jgi:hypothetical protein